MSQMSITTTCTPWHRLSDLVPAIAAAGFTGIEPALGERHWDPQAAVAFWGNNPAMLDLHQAVDEAAALAQLLDQHHLHCPCLGSYALSSDAAGIDVAFGVAAILGSDAIRVRVPWYGPGASYAELLTSTRSCYRDLEVRAAASKTACLIELHDRSICPTASAAMRIVDGLDPDRVGVIFDPGNYTSEGLESIPMVIDLLGPYLRHVHVKDTAIMRLESARDGLRWSGRPAALGQGDLDWPWLIAALRAHGYAGWWSIENFTGIEDGPQRMRADAAWLRECLAP